MSSTRVPGHALLDEGRTYGPGYFRRHVGPAKCSCGLLSPFDLDSDAKRKQWHREHKAKVVSA